MNRRNTARFAIAALVVAWIGISILVAPDSSKDEELTAGEEPLAPLALPRDVRETRGPATPVDRAAAREPITPIPAASHGEVPPAPSVPHGQMHGLPAADDGVEFEEPYPLPPQLAQLDLSKQTADEAAAKSHGCMQCHKTVHDPHYKGSMNLGCVDCHGGNPNTADKHLAHVQPRLAGAWPPSQNPVRSYTLLNHEDPMFIRFVNPGDLRIAHMSCGLAGCHPEETLQVRKSMMTHGCMLWGAALYNNGAVPHKWSRYGESYSMNGKPQRLVTVPRPTPEETDKKGVLPYLDPLPRFNITQPGNVLRIFERGGRFVIEVGIPERLEEPGRPRQRVSNRGLGTQNRTDPVYIGLQKTRLLDPTLNFMGTNDHAGDYRSSGCTACHVIYANDRSPINSGPYSVYGNKGRAAPVPDRDYTGPEKRVYEIVEHVDPTIPKNESGHPIQHRFVTGVPTSQCIVCHIHPGTTVMNSYTGYIWWDQETDGEHMYPPFQKDPTAEAFTQAEMSNPNQIAAKGLWSDPDFLDNVTDLNSRLKHTQFADYHGHGWVFRAVYAKDTEGRLLDNRGHVVPHKTTKGLQAAVKFPEQQREIYRDRKWTNEELVRVLLQEESLRQKYEEVPVHLLDIHLAKGMHCVDCHFVQDMHGNTKLYGEVRAAVEITCRDCHGDTDKYAHHVAGPPSLAPSTLRTSGPAAKDDPLGRPEREGRDLLAMRTPFGKRRFEVVGGKLVQNSLVEPGLSWEVPQTLDTIDPEHPRFNARSALAKTVRFEGNDFAWGNVPGQKEVCAHDSSRMSCIACHSSWNPSCFGCHLPQKADRKMPELHNEGDISKNYVAYNFQTLRDDVFMIGHDGNVTGNRIGPTRSSCAIHVGSYNGNRESIYVQQQTVSAEGPSGIAFSSNVPHTVGERETTKNCTSCHVSAANDNNAVMAQLMMHGTGYMNFIGRWCYVASKDHGLWSVEVTERSEPQSVIGSTMHELAYPKYFEEHVERHRELEHAHEHPGNDISDNLFRPFKKHEILDVQLRGEFLYAACGEAGVRLYDVAFIDNKAFSERITSAPVSPIGQQFYVRTKYATSVCAPTTIVPDPTRKHLPENHEPTIPLMYAFLYVTDLHEGLVMINLATALDGNPTNRFLKKDIVYNPGGLLKGARHCTIVGHYAYVSCDAGLVVVSLEDTDNLVVTCVIGHEYLHEPHCVQAQFRYAFVADEDGLKVLDTTDIAHPKPVGKLKLPGEPQNVYVARTYAYVSCGHAGMVIVNISNPEKPYIDQIYDAHGEMNDVHDIQLGVTYNSEFAYVADGHNGLRVVQLTSPETPGNNGFSPRPTPQLIATFEIPEEGGAYAVSRGVDRDRAVDESGNHLAVFGRVGAKPLSLEEQRRLYHRPGLGVWQVIDGKRDYDKFRITDGHIADWRDGRTSTFDLHKSVLRAREFDLARQLEEHYGRAYPLRGKGSQLPRPVPKEARRLGPQGPTIPRGQPRVPLPPLESPRP